MNIHPRLALLTLPLGLIPTQAHAQQPANKPNAEKPAAAPVAKPPALLVKKERKQASSPLRVENLDVNVTVTGNTAETTMTMVFRNDTDRILEGELVFPLGQGMTVSGYALDVNGTMRQGVIVPKDLARKAYENTIRQQIDPGLVEWTKGNNFRTRIYPIPAKGTKKVSVSYVETLNDSGEKLNYQLPLAYPEKIDEFKITIDVIRPSGPKKIVIEQNAGLKLSQDDSKQWKLQAQQKDFAADTTLKFSIPHENVAKQLVHKASNGDLFFYAVDTIKGQHKSLPRPLPKSVRLIWDASHSGAQRDHNKEIRLIEAYLKKTGATEVSLNILRNTLEAPIVFNTSEGAAKLVAHLRTLRYDGATRTDLLDLATTKCDATLLVSDGIATIGDTRPTTGDKPVFLFHAAQSAEHGLLGLLAAQSGGAYINLHRKNTQDGLKAMTSQRYSLLSVEGQGVEQVSPSVATPVEKQVSIAGKLTSKKPVQLTLKYGIGGKVMHSRTMTIDPSKVSDKATKVPRLWAQKKLMELDAEAEKNRLDIIDIAQRHGVVTRFTSLLVLDRLQDYVRYGINPPEPELQEEYDKLLRQHQEREERLRANDNHFKVVLPQWKKMIQWHKLDHPKIGDILVKQTKQITAKLATREQQITKELAKNKNQQELLELKKQLTAITEVKKLQKQAKDWNKRKGINATPEDYNTIAQAFNKAVATVFQNSGKNKEIARQMAIMGLPSSAAGGIPVPTASVIESNASVEFGSSDAFADGFGGESANGFAFSGQQESRKRGEQMAADRGGPNTTPNPKTSLTKWDPNTPYLKALRKAATNKQALEPLYFDWKEKNLNSSAFYLDVADFFLQQKQPIVASRILSNVAELDVESPALLRILAHRYDQLGSHNMAELVFREVLRLRPEEPQSHRDLALVLQKLGKYQEAADLLWHVTSTKWDGRLEGIQLIALTELNGMIANHPNQINTKAYDKEAIYNLDTDIRIILTWDADNTDIDLWVVDPIGEKCNYSHNRTKTGGHMSKDFTQGYGPEVFMIKNAINGKYQIKAKYYGNTQQKLAGEVTIQATLVTHWGRKNEKRESITLRLKGKKDIINIGSLDFSSK